MSEDIDFSVKKGDVTSIIGSSGSGKSTLLRCVNLLETPTSGEIIYRGQNIETLKGGQSEYRSHVGMVFQSFNLFANMSVLKNCVIGQTKVLGKTKDEAQAEAMRNAKQVILDVAKDFEAITGQKYGFFEGYKLEDAEYAVVAIGSVCGTTKDAIDALRAKGIKAGLLKIRVFRPFPGEEIAKALKHCKAIAIMDRSESYSSQGGPLGAEVTAALYREKATAETVNIMYGLSGRDGRVEDMEGVYEMLQKLAAGEVSFDQYPYLGLRD